MKTPDEMNERFEANRCCDPEEDLTLKFRKHARDRDIEIVGRM